MNITNEHRKYIKKEPLYKFGSKKVMGKFVDKDNKMIYIIKDGEITYTELAENVFRQGFRLNFKPKIIKIK